MANFKAKFDSKTGLYTLIIVIGGAIYKYVGPNLNAIIAYVQALFGIK